VRVPELHRSYLRTKERATEYYTYTTITTTNRTITRRILGPPTTTEDETSTTRRPRLLGPGVLAGENDEGAMESNEGSTGAGTLDRGAL
jgi:hypothetical protein